MILGQSLSRIETDQMETANNTKIEIDAIWKASKVDAVIGNSICRRQRKKRERGGDFVFLDIYQIFLVIILIKLRLL